MTKVHLDIKKKLGGGGDIIIIFTHVPIFFYFWTRFACIHMYIGDLQITFNFKISNNSQHCFSGGSNADSIGRPALNVTSVRSSNVCDG